MLDVIDGGLRTTVQDMGRRGGQALGIPPSGAQDGFALQRSRILLVGNPPGGPLLIRDDPGAAGLELTLGRLKLRALQDHVLALDRRGHRRDRGRRGGALLDELRAARGPDARLRPRAERRAGLPRGPRRHRRSALPGQPRHACQRRLRRAGGAPAREGRPPAGGCGHGRGGGACRAPAAARSGSGLRAAHAGAHGRRPRGAPLHRRERRGLLRHRLEAQPQGGPDRDALHRPGALLQAGAPALPDRGRRARTPPTSSSTPAHRSAPCRCRPASSRSCSASIRPASAATRGSPS